MFKVILSTFSHLKVYCFTDGSKKRFFWSFSFQSKTTIAAPCIIFWFSGETLLVLFFWTKVSNIPRLLSNAINDDVYQCSKTTFKYSKSTFGKTWIRYRQASCYGCFEDKSENFTIHYTVHQSLFIDYYSLIIVHSHCSLLLFMVLFTPNFSLFKGSCPLSLGQNSFFRISFLQKPFSRKSSTFLVSTTISLQSL